MSPKRQPRACAAQAEKERAAGAQFACGGLATERKAETQSKGLASPRAKGNIDISQQPPVSGENNAAHLSLKPHWAISTSTNQPYFTGGDCCPGAQQVWGWFGSHGVTHCTGGMTWTCQDGAGMVLGSPDAGAEASVQS